MGSKERNMLDDTTWEFLGTGWWIFHTIVIIGLFYLGAWYALK